MANLKLWDAVSGRLFVSACSMLFLVNTVMKIPPSSAQYQLEFHPPRTLQDNQGFLTREELEHLLRQAQYQEESLASQIRHQRDQVVFPNQERELEPYRQQLLQQQRARHQSQLPSFQSAVLNDQQLYNVQQIPQHARQNSQVIAIDASHSTGQREQLPDIYRQQLPLANQQTNINLSSSQEVAIRELEQPHTIGEPSDINRQQFANQPTQFQLQSPPIFQQTVLANQQTQIQLQSLPKFKQIPQRSPVRNEQQQEPQPQQTQTEVQNQQTQSQLQSPPEFQRIPQKSPVRNEQQQEPQPQQTQIDVQNQQTQIQLQSPPKFQRIPQQSPVKNEQQQEPQPQQTQLEVQKQLPQQEPEDIEIIPQRNKVDQKLQQQNQTQQLREYLQRLVIQNLREKILQEYKQETQQEGGQRNADFGSIDHNQEELKKRLDEILLQTLKERILQVQQEQKTQLQGPDQLQVRENQEQLQRNLQEILSQSLREQSQQKQLQQQLQRLRAQNDQQFIGVPGESQQQPEKQNLLQLLVQQAIQEQAQNDKAKVNQQPRPREQQQQQLQRQRQEEEQRRQQLRIQQRQQRKQRLEKQQEQLQQQLLRADEQEREERRRQRQQQPELGNVTRTKPTSVRDLFRTPSCVDPPIRCPHPRIQFYLYTRSTQSNPELLDVTNPNSLTNSRFRPQFPTKVIIHGFGGGRNLAPSTDLRKAYFTRGEYNIIIVDYSTLVVEPCLSQIEWGPRFCAECIAQMVTYLARHPKGTAPDNLHLLGYSVGAHIAGLVANYLPQGKLGRITGLDPTIIFYMGSNRSRDLDPSDAHFVDVIHTGAGILGQWGPNGHVDFYVNGGTTQPGCQHGSLLKTLSCDHTKVTPYYIESINSKAGFWASPCTSQVLFFLGFCTPRDEDYILMGEDVPRSARGLYYLTTNARKPYAKGFPGRRKPVLRGNT